MDEKLFAIIMYQDELAYGMAEDCYNLIAMNY